MCIKVLTQYACGHARVEFMNWHCRCALIVGPVREVEGRCGRRECGGELRADEGLVKRESESVRDGVEVAEGEAMEEVEEENNKKVGI